MNDERFDYDGGSILHLGKLAGETIDALMVGDMKFTLLVNGQRVTKEEALNKYASFVNVAKAYIRDKKQRKEEEDAMMEELSNSIDRINELLNYIHDTSHNLEIKIIKV
jgi:uncharacterized FlaG/YvyC family protein